MLNFISRTLYFLQNSLFCSGFAISPSLHQFMSLSPSLSRNYYQALSESHSLTTTINVLIRKLLEGKNLHTCAKTETRKTHTKSKRKSGSGVLYITRPKMGNNITTLKTPHTYFVMGPVCVCFFFWMEKEKGWKASETGWVGCKDGWLVVIGNDTKFMKNTRTPPLNERSWMKFSNRHQNIRNSVWRLLGKRMHSNLEKVYVQKFREKIVTPLKKYKY